MEVVVWLSEMHWCRSKMLLFIDAG